jgi:hypothetical protein
MKNFHSKWIALTTILSIFIAGCSYENEETLYPKNENGCDTANVTYTNTVAPILSASCNGCHGGSNPQAGIKLDTYDDLKVWIDNGRVLGSIKHEQGFSPMPKNLPKLSECKIQQIETWIEAGALNN